MRNFGVDGCEYGFALVVGRVVRDAMDEGTWGEVVGGIFWSRVGFIQVLRW